MRACIPFGVLLPGWAILVASLPCRGQPSFQPLGDLPGGAYHSFARGLSGDGTTVVGSSSSAAGTEAYRRTDQGMTGLAFLPGGSRSEAFASAQDGSVIVGQSQSEFAQFEAFRWTASAMVGLGDLPGGEHWSDARAVSADGSVVVGFSNANNGREAFLWNAQDGMQRLLDVLVDEYHLDLDDWTLMAAMDISDDGRTIIGDGISPEGNIEAWIAHVPEPGTAFVMLLGGLLVTRRHSS